MEVNKVALFLSVLDKLAKRSLVTTETALYLKRLSPDVMRNPDASETAQRRGRRAARLGTPPDQENAELGGPPRLAGNPRGKGPVSERPVAASGGDAAAAAAARLSHRVSLHLLKRAAL